MKLMKYLPLALVLTVAGVAWGYGASAATKNTDNPPATVETDNCCLTGDCCCPGQGACCDSDVVYDWAKVVNAAGPRAKVDATKGWTAMEALLYLLEGVDLPAKVKLDKFINSCGTLADFIGNGGDGVAVEILDAFGDGTGLYAETSAGS